MTAVLDACETVLIVDDHDDTRAVFAEALRSAGYAVEVASHGWEAVALARRHRPRVIVMDLAMPGLDGWDTTQTLKSAPATRDAWMIVVTARSDPADLERAWAAGCDATLQKPIHPSKLIEAVRSGMKNAP